jgi:hypothetical protein
VAAPARRLEYGLGPVLGRYLHPRVDTIGGLAPASGLRQHGQHRRGHLLLRRLLLLQGAPPAPTPRPATRPAADPPASPRNATFAMPDDGMANVRRVSCS